MILLNLWSQQYLSGTLVCTPICIEPLIMRSYLQHAQMSVSVQTSICKEDTHLNWTEIKMEGTELCGLRLYPFSLLIGSSRLWWFPKAKTYNGCQIEKAYRKGLHSLLRNGAQECFQNNKMCGLEVDIEVGNYIFSEYRCSFSMYIFRKIFQTFFNESLNVPWEAR